MNELVKTELFSLLSESSQENTNEEMQSAKVILYSFKIQKYTQGIEPVSYTHLTLPGNRTETPSPTGFTGNLHTCATLRVVFPAKVLPYLFPE